METCDDDFECMQSPDLELCMGICVLNLPAIIIATILVIMSISTFVYWWHRKRSKSKLYETVPSSNKGRSMPNEEVQQPDISVEVEHSAAEKSALSAQHKASC
eukprot:COSAG01_NODE_1602_length_9759_cov_35.078157_4_plen_103_part_00